MPVIPPSLQPTSMTPGAITVAQQRDIKQYGSLQKAAEAKYEQAVTKASQDNIAQQKVIDQRIAELNAVVQRYRMDRDTGYSSRYRRIAKYQTKSAEAELEQLYNLKAGLSEGGAYQDIKPIISEVKSYGDDVRSYYQQRGVAKKKAMTKAQERREAIATLQKYGTPEQIAAAREQGIAITPGGPRITQSISEPTIIIPSTKKDFVPEDRGLYYELGEDGKPVGNVIYTSPTKVGPKIDPRSIRMTEPRREVVTPPKENVYIPIEKVSYEPGRQPLRVSPIGETNILYGSTGLTGPRGEEAVFTKTPIEAGMTKQYQERAEITMIPIRPDQKVRLKSRVTELLPSGAGVALSDVFLEQVYVTSSADYDKIQELIRDPKFGAGRKLRIFLRKKQAELKADLLEYNKYVIKSNTKEGLTDKEFEKAEKLRVKINQGQIGTLENLLEREVIEQGTGKAKAKALALYGTREFYEQYTTAAALSLGVGAVGAIAPAKFTAALSTITKPLKYLETPTYLGFAGFRTAQETIRTGDLQRGIVVGASGGAGLITGIYSKDIVRGVSRGLGEGTKKIVQFGKKTVVTAFKHPPKIVMNKRGQVSVSYEQIGGRSKEHYKKLEKIVKALREQDLMTAKKQVRILIKSIVENSNITQVEKISRLKNLKKLVEAVRPELLLPSAADLARGSVRPEALQSLGITPGTKEKVIADQFFDPLRGISTESASVYAGLGMYERTSPQYVSKLEAPTTASALLFSLQEEVLTDTKVEEDTKQSPGQLLAPIQEPIAEQQPIQEPISEQTPITSPITGTIPRQIPRQTEGGLLTGRPLEERDKRGKPPRRPRPKRFGFPDFDFSKDKTKDVTQAYHGEIKQKGKWVKVTEKPHTKEGALDKVARVIDETLSAQGRLIKTKKQDRITKKGKKKKKIKLEGGDGYYEKNRYKFRDFKIIRGKRVRLGNKIIEKKEYRTDKPGETKRLTKAQDIGRARKSILGLPLRRTKKNSFRL